jgi:hypothetical protein
MSRTPERLDPQEAELAARLRELPQPAPPAALDQQILDAARGALRGPSRRRPSWHWGSAAAAALALLVVAPQWWQERLEEAQLAKPDHQQRVLQQAPSELDEAAEDTPASRHAEARAERFSTAAPVPPPAPAAPPAPELAAEPDAPPAPATASSAGLRTDDDRPAAAGRERRGAAELGRSLPLRDAPAPLHKQAVGQGLAVRVDDELQRIQRLRETGELEAARAALRQLLATHPQLEVPPTLRDLLEEPPR